MGHMSDLAEELRSMAGPLTRTAARLEDPDIAQPLEALESAAGDLSRAWSGSQLGYHSTVYYVGFAPPPPGAHFSPEWGLKGVFQGSTGEWREYRYEDVLAVIRERAGNPDLSTAEYESKQAREAMQASQVDAVSVLHTFLTAHPDEFLSSIKAEIEGLFVLTKSQGVRAQMPNGGTFMSRDSVALSQGIRPAPHQEVLAEVVALRAPFLSSRELAVLVSRAAAHIERVTRNHQRASQPVGDRVFIGHGRSLLWRELKDFLQDRLHLPWDEFNRVPVAGVTNITRLSEMLDSAGVAFLLLTGEDERADGEAMARQNVVHEAGLFQGRLGFTRAIVLLEEGCAEFSNIQGLGQIRFPRGRISAVFEEVRQVLEREGLLDT